MTAAGAAERFAALAEELAADPGVTVGRMLRSHGLATNGKFFAFCQDDALVVKVRATVAAELVASGVARPYAPSPGRVMREWIAVDDRPDRDWRALVVLARDHVQSLTKGAGSR